MFSYLQIADDPTKWWLSQPADVSHLSGPTARFEVTAPLAGAAAVSQGRSQRRPRQRGGPAAHAESRRHDGAGYLPADRGRAVGWFGWLRAAGLG